MRRWTQKRLNPTKEEDAAAKSDCLTLYPALFLSRLGPSVHLLAVTRPALLSFILAALLPAVHLTQQLPAQPHAAGRPAGETLQGGILEEGPAGMEPSLLPSLPLRGTPSRPAALQQSGSEQL